jgi:hypothetical protein
VTAGAAYLELGPDAGEPGIESLSDADAHLDGELTDGQAGQAVSGAGDVNGDGYDDLLIGAPYEDSDAENAGAAYVVFGPIDEPIGLAGADVRSGGVLEGLIFGFSVSSGDLNGDGYSDVVVGGGNDVWVFSGPLSGDLDVTDADATISAYSAGWAVATGDLDGDGLDDLLVSAPFGGDIRGVVYVFYGPVSGILDPVIDADARISGETPNDAAGVSLTSAGDANGDGYDDVLIGSTRESSAGFEAGATYLVYGPVSGEVSLSDAAAKLTGEAPLTNSGTSVAFVDLNGDGLDDVLTGAPFGDAVYVMYAPLPQGTTNLANADAKLIAQPGLFGWSVANAGDVDGDGLEDVVIGAQSDSTSVEGAGAAYVLRSPF